jgi:hypothetical protein
MNKRKDEEMAKRPPSSDKQLAGLRQHAQVQKQRTIDRLREAISTLTSQGKPISATTIREVCGLEYAAIRRNPEALLLYQQHSTFLKQKRKRTKNALPDMPSPRDPYLSYKKTDLVNRLRKEMARRAELETHYATVLQDAVQRDMKVAELEAELARYREHFQHLRLTVQQQEYQG